MYITEELDLLKIIG